MPTLWEWDSFDEQVESEANAIREHMQVTSLSQTQVIPTVNRLLDASVWASQQGDEVRAVAALRVAVTVDKTCWKAYYNLGWQYMTIGKRLHQPFMGKITVTDGQTYNKSLGERITFYENAVHCLEKALGLNPQHAKGWCVLGQAQYYMGDYDQARATLRKAIDLDPIGEGGRMAKESLEILESSLK